MALHIAVIGCGNIGTRHAQGLAKLQHEVELHFVDPFQHSLDKLDIAIQPILSDSVTCHYHTQIKELPADLFLAVVATNAMDRLACIKVVNQHCDVHHWLIEKFLFNHLDEYAEASALFETNPNVYVNCARRAFPAYQDIRKLLKNIHSIKLTGNSWGLCCNSIHFIDLFSFLLDDVPTEVQFNQENFTLIPSKREGYIEATGSLDILYSRVKATIECCAGDFAGISMKLESDGGIFIITEAGGQIHLSEPDGNETIYPLPYQSQLTTDYADQLINAQPLQLTRYEVSAQQHLIFLQALHAILDSINYNGIRNIT